MDNGNHGLSNCGIVGFCWSIAHVHVECGFRLLARASLHVTWVWRYTLGQVLLERGFSSRWMDFCFPLGLHRYLIGASCLWACIIIIGLGAFVFVFGWSIPNKSNQTNEKTNVIYIYWGSYLTTLSRLPRCIFSKNLEHGFLDSYFFFNAAKRNGISTTNLQCIEIF